MEVQYKVELISDNKYKVIKVTTIYGERLNAYESEPNIIEEKIMLESNLSECESYIKLCEGGYIK